MSDLNDIRIQMKAYRQGLSEMEILQFSSEIEKRVYEEIKKYPDYKTVLCFYPLESEVNLLTLYEKLLKENYFLYFPKTYQHEIMFYHVDSMRDFKSGAFQIMEPYDTRDKNLYLKELGFCIVPGLAFTTSMHRIGYGGGFYDRFLRSKSLIKLGVCFDDQVIDFFPEDHDVDMDAVITEKSIYKKN